MAKLSIEAEHIEIVEAFIEREKLSHLSFRKRADTITLRDGVGSDRIDLVRVRRISSQRWALDIATTAGRWEPTPLQGVLHELLDKLVLEFPWVLTPRS